mmetsp:Transcript_21921/g.55269  ORF Transcript_21921/g.55269 Transcript_21921/m.55269 type:complete len:101 (+) Transcript_21921:1937-2239(+)
MIDDESGSERREAITQQPECALESDLVMEVEMVDGDARRERATTTTSATLTTRYPNSAKGRRNRKPRSPTSAERARKYLPFWLRFGGSQLTPPEKNAARA